jgi:hypothetical protein
VFTLTLSQTTCSEAAHVYINFTNFELLTHVHAVTILLPIGLWGDAARTYKKYENLEWLRHVLSVTMLLTAL